MISRFSKTLISYCPLCIAVVMQDYVTEHSIPAWHRSKDSLSSTYYLNTHCKGRTSLTHKTALFNYIDIPTTCSHNSSVTWIKRNRQTSNTKTSEVITNYKFITIILQPLFRILQIKQDNSKRHLCQVKIKIECWMKFVGKRPA